MEIEVDNGIGYIGLGRLGRMCNAIFDKKFPENFSSNELKIVLNDKGAYLTNDLEEVCVLRNGHFVQLYWLDSIYSDDMISVEEAIDMIKNKNGVEIWEISEDDFNLLQDACVTLEQLHDIAPVIEEYNNYWETELMK